MTRRAPCHEIAALLLGLAWMAMAHGAAAGDGCVAVAALPADDADVARNRTALADPSLCLEQDRFDEGALHWSLLIVRDTGHPERVLWMVPHNDEHDAFDSAVAGVRTYGGTVVAVRTGGTRNNGAQDPNRNFDRGTAHRCPRQVGRSPLYTARVMRWHVGDAPIVALHTNERGIAGDGRGGSGTISITRPPRGTIALRATASPSGAPLGESPDDTMIFVASRRVPAADPALSRISDAMRGQGVHVAWEQVTEDGDDCSLSNYAVLTGMRGYFNIEVVRGDGATQRHIIDLLMARLPPDWR